MGKISLKGMRFYAHHGWYEEERQIGNHFQVEIDVIVPFGSEEKIQETVNYEDLYRICQDEMSRPRKLMETVAESITNKIAREFRQIEKVTVRIGKVPQLGGAVDFVWVESEK